MISDAEFRRQWESGATCVQIAEVFGLTERQVWTRRKKLGLEARSSLTGTTAKRSHERNAHPATEPLQERQLDVSAIHPTPGWDLPILAQLFRCKGYADLAAFAAKHGKSITTVQQKWHQVRAAR